MPLVPLIGIEPALQLFRTMVFPLSFQRARLLMAPCSDLWPPHGHGTCGKGGHAGGDCPAGEKENEGSVPEELYVVEPIVVAGPEVVVGPEVLVEPVVVAKSEEIAESEVVTVPCLNGLTSGPLSPGTHDDCVVPIGKKPQVSMACQPNLRSGKPSVQKAVKRTKPGNEDYSTWIHTFAIVEEMFIVLFPEFLEVL
ncbi:Hypothetical predicted protein [Octopus vulgaris]|uniref:Uncharacterized protein n=1 Tax=Octopus vulgaris TaxID=6645 RepID=A0AA36AU30_OCTVU|nr:Hypothetical predicted protein [Octopus vulgaris]